MIDTEGMAKRSYPAWLRMAGAGVFLQLCYFALVGSAEALAAVTNPVILAGAVVAIAAGVALSIVAVGLTVEAAGVDAPLRGLITGTSRSLRRAVLPAICAILALAAAAPILEGLAHDAGLRGTTAILGPPPAYAVALLFCCLSVVEAPWMEEVSIRGFLFTGLQRRFGFWPAALVSSFVWAALHREAEVLVAFTVVGISLAWLRQRTGSVRSGILLHGLWNTVVALHTFGWRPVLPADILLIATLVLARSDRSYRPLRALRTALAQPHRAARALSDRMPAGPPLGARATALAGAILLAGYGFQAAGLYGLLGASTQRHVELIGLPAMLLLAGVAASTRRTWRPPGALALAGVAGALVDAGARAVTGLGGDPGVSQLTALAALLIAWWLWGVARAGDRPAVRRGAGAASLAYMGALFAPIPTGLWDVAWHCSMLLLAAGSIAWLGLAAMIPADRPLPAIRWPRVALGGRRLGVATAVAIVAVAAGVVSIPHPDPVASAAQPVARAGACDPLQVHLHVRLVASGGLVHSLLAATSDPACHPDGAITLRIGLTASDGHALPPGLAGLAPVERWMSEITPDAALGALRDARTRSRWCATDPQPGPYTLTATVVGGGQASATAMICGPAPAPPGLLGAIPTPVGAPRLTATGPACYRRGQPLATPAGLVRTFDQGQLAAVAWSHAAAADLGRFTATGAPAYVTVRPGSEPDGTGMFVIAVYPPGRAAARAGADRAAILRSARAALVSRHLPAETRLRVFVDGNLLVFQLGASPTAVSNLGAYLQDATVAACTS